MTKETCIESSQNIEKYQKLGIRQRVKKHDKLYIWGRGNSMALSEVMGTQNISFYVKNPRDTKLCTYGKMATSQKMRKGPFYGLENVKNPEI